MSTSFSRVYGEDTWTPTADAVVEMVRTVKSVASCTFCSLNSTDKNHTLLIQLGANRRPSTLIVDGEIYVNSSNGKGANDPDSCTDPDILNCGKWVVQGDGFDIFGIGGRMEAKRINVVGGWETHDNGIATAREATCPIDQRPTPPQYPLLPPPVGPILQSNICIHQPAIPDPLKEFLAPTQADYPVQSSQQLVLAGAATHNLQPGVYVGGIRASGNANVVLAPGVYFIAGGGLAISGNANFIADGVTLYNASPTGQTGNAGAISIAGNGRVVLSPPDSGPFGGMTIFQERSSRRSMILNPQNAAQCASQAAQGEPQGCLGGLSGTIYLPGTSANCRAKNDCLVTITATGTANLQIISDKLLVRNGGVARFTYKASGFASTTTTTTLVE
jgi:hypothetical protein